MTNGDDGPNEYGLRPDGTIAVYARVSFGFYESAVADKQRLNRLEAAIREHASSKADDRCWEDDLRLYDAAGIAYQDPRVGDPAAMMANCYRYITQRCTGGGPWKTYVELEAEIERLRTICDWYDATLRRAKREPTVPVLSFGRDHYSTLLYVETRVVDHRGQPDHRRMRCDRDRHPQHAHMPKEAGPCSPTRLAKGLLLSNHDDWDCVADMIAAGWINDIGTEDDPQWRLTSVGWAVAHEYRRSLAEKVRP